MSYDKLLDLLCEFDENSLDEDDVSYHADDGESSSPPRRTNLPTNKLLAQSAIQAINYIPANIMFARLIDKKFTDPEQIKSAIEELFEPPIISALRPFLSIGAPNEKGRPTLEEILSSRRLLPSKILSSRRLLPSNSSDDGRTAAHRRGRLGQIASTVSPTAAARIKPPIAMRPPATDATAAEILSYLKTTRQQGYGSKD